MREIYWAERGPNIGQNEVWYGKYRQHNQSSVILTVNDRDGLTQFTSERAARDEAFRRYHDQFKARAS